MKKKIKVYKRDTTNLINIPKSILEETKLDKEKELEVKNVGKKIIITKVEEK